MRAVHVGVGHDDDPAVAQFRAVEPVADAAAQCLDQIAQLLVLAQLVGRRAMATFRIFPRNGNTA